MYVGGHICYSLVCELLMFQLERLCHSILKDFLLIQARFVAVCITIVWFSPPEQVSHCGTFVSRLIRLFLSVLNISIVFKCFLRISVILLNCTVSFKYFIILTYVFITISLNPYCNLLICTK